MPEQFLFRCKGCNRVAPETEWTLIGRTQWADAVNMRRYPIVECPSCQSRDIDMNHGMRLDTEASFRLHDPPRRPQQREN